MASHSRKTSYSLISELPLSLMRAVGRRSETRLKASTRFANVKQELYERVLTPEFAGYWFCRGTPEQPRRPEQCDLVIYYLHGGGYKTGHPATPLGSFLRVAEIAAESGVSIAVFALNYSLAPEAMWPTQINQAVAGYRYLLEDMKLDSARISVQGDSAGGHMVLSFYSALVGSTLPKPTGGAFMVSPWIDLRCSSNGSFITNRTKDYLVRDLTANAGYEAIPRDREAELSHIINFLRPRPDNKLWTEILPEKVSVAVGKNDLFYDDVVAFVDVLRKDGLQVDFEEMEDKGHVWQFFDDGADLTDYFMTVGELPKGLMTGAAALKADLVCTLLRAAQPWTPLSILRFTGQAVEPKFAASTRFGANKSSLYEKVDGKDFSGYWICKGSPTSEQLAPKDCDVVLLYLHGGAYRIGHPAQALAIFLRVAEVAKAQGINLAVFGLDYSLAPEAKFPIQLEQTKAAYNYFTEKLNVSAEKIAVLGDSAGAHLALCFLDSLTERGVKKPEAGVFLVAPWLDLRCTRAGSFVRNEKVDYLIRGDLMTAGHQIMPAEHDRTEKHLVNFTLPRPGKEWKSILPKKVWVGIGGNDLFLDDTVAFVEGVRKAGIDARLDVEEGKCHDWLMVEDILDVDTYFSSKGRLPNGLMKGADALAKAIVSTVKS
ncbi:alpha/beta-hydrolase [Aureobasidium subglaciale]|nr:alpha/beta-hydrolase [Aureobasidium subglaciale]